MSPDEVYCTLDTFLRDKSDRQQNHRVAILARIVAHIEANERRYLADAIQGRINSSRAALGAVGEVDCNDSAPR